MHGTSKMSTFKSKLVAYTIIFPASYVSLFFFCSTQDEHESPSLVSLYIVGEYDLLNDLVKDRAMSIKQKVHAQRSTP